MKKSTKQAKLEQIATEIIKHNVCPDLAQTAKQLVMGDGNPDADIVFIGEAPGKNEDESGKPFVGASGKLLDEMLASIKLDRSQVYITNIVKYRPPDNRDPKPTEKEAFFPYLNKQLEVIQPRVIVPLGRHSMNVFLPDAVISEAHGERFGGSPVILPLYHPAAAIYNRKLRDTLFADFKKLEQFI